MTSHTRLTPPLILTGGAPTASVFTTRMVELLFNTEQERRMTAMDEWENEGGSVAADTEKAPFSIVRENGAQGKLMPQHPHGADAVRNAFYAADRVSPVVAGQSSSEHVCPQCNAPLDRIKRRIVDRLSSWISPVRRYLPHEGLELRLGRESAYEVTFSADARAGETYDGRHGARNP